MRVPPFSLLLAPFALAGCAAIVAGSTQSLSVQTAPAQGAACKLTNDKGTWFIPSTPGTVSVHRAYGPLLVACDKDGARGLLQQDSSVKGLMFGNILLGGLIGAAVDISTGAGYDYPDLITVPVGKPEAKGS